MSINEKSWIVIEELAEYLRCSVRHLRKMVANRKIPFTYLGGKALFNRKRIDEWMLAQEEKPEEVAYESQNEKVISVSSELDRKILPTCDREKVDSLVQKLMDYNEHFVTSLRNNLRKDLDAHDYEYLSAEVYAQLSRWCHPRRNASRERWVLPIVHEISMLLFGRIIDRVE